MIRRITLPQLLALPFARPLRNFRSAWLRKQEEHYLACAGTEARKAMDANYAVRHYQKKAALARSACNELNHPTRNK